jgi:hypothetical protein
MLAEVVTHARHGPLNLSTRSKVGLHSASPGRKEKRGRGRRSEKAKERDNEHLAKSKAREGGTMDDMVWQYSFP